MSCPASTGKSGSSWLDRLRTSKGFPENGATDLENFLQNTNSETSDPSPTPDQIFGPKQNEDKRLFNIMSNVLNELFNFGDNNCGNSTKSARKQANPRICAFSNNCTDENNAASEKAAASRSGENNAGVERVKELLDRREYEREREREERDGALSGFSRTEVTVIDTSYETWKFDKLLYRKKNVWKVRDKKGKSDNVGSKKKRKVSGGAEEDGYGGKKSKVDEKEGCELPLNESNKSEAHGKASDKVSKILKKKQRDLKSDNGSSSIVLIKSIPISKKNGTSISRSCLKLK
ncbi:hypothetical protein ACJIZ3_022611 [Penstemon smallii]|uniref:Uncharacterized protein n=1 Tax=Penstemon smallii TaxID=265156 RepID=A0ABD3TMQ7_9LAMI